jgi:Arylsulfotransferase (ASST)
VAVDGGYHAERHRSSQTNKLLADNSQRDVVLGMNGGIVSRVGRLVAFGVVIVGASIGVWLGFETGGGQSAPPPPPPYQHFLTRPGLRPPLVTILHPASGTAPGLIFLAPKRKVAQDGPMIIDDRGQVVWFDPLPAKGVTDFKVQRYQGRPVLTWWQGQVAKGGYSGSASGYMIMDSSYHVIKVVHAGNGLTGDIHDFQLTPSGTALMTIFHKVPYDLSSIGGPKQGYVLEGVVQEVSLQTGRVLFEWHSLDHVAPSESYLPLGPKTGLLKSPYDYFHINSVTLDTDGNLIVSSRHTSTVYKIRKSDGAIMWHLGGKKSDFTFGPGAQFAWQHDARRQADGTITLFNNNAQAAKKGIQSRALVLRLDLTQHRATLVHAYAHTPPLLSTSQGDLQHLPNGNVFVGWGGNPFFTEYSASGRVLLDGRFGADDDSYRAFRFVWVGRPTTKPAIAIGRATSGLPIVYASWNGATEVASWQVLAGPDVNHLSPTVTAAKGGFETAIHLTASAPYAMVRALDAKGAVLGSSPVHKS